MTSQDKKKSRHPEYVAFRFRKNVKERPPVEAKSREVQNAPAEMAVPLSPPPPPPPPKHKPTLTSMPAHVMPSPEPRPPPPINPALPPPPPPSQKPASEETRASPQQQQRYHAPNPYATPTSPEYAPTSPEYAPSSPAYQMTPPRSGSLSGWPPWVPPMGFATSSPAHQMTPPRYGSLSGSPPWVPPDGRGAGPVSPGHSPSYPGHSPSTQPSTAADTARTHTSQPVPPPAFTLPLIEDYSSKALDDADMPCYNDFQHEQYEQALSSLLTQGQKNRHILLKKSITVIRRRITALMQGTNLTTTPITESPFPAHFNPATLDRRRIETLPWDRLYFFEKTGGELHLLFLSKRYSPVLVNNKFQVEPLNDPVLKMFCDACNLECCLMIGEIVRCDGVGQRVFMAFDLMTGPNGKSLSDKPFYQRFAALEMILKTHAKRSKNAKSQELLILQKRHFTLKNIDVLLSLVQDKDLVVADVTPRKEATPDAMKDEDDIESAFKRILSDGGGSATRQEGKALQEDGELEPRRIRLCDGSTVTVFRYYQDPEWQKTYGMRGHRCDGLILQETDATLATETHNDIAQSLKVKLVNTTDLIVNVDSPLWKQMAAFNSTGTHSTTPNDPSKGRDIDVPLALEGPRQGVSEDGLKLSDSSRLYPIPGECGVLDVSTAYGKSVLRKFMTRPTNATRSAGGTVPVSDATDQPLKIYTVVECMYDCARGRYRVLRVRPDKTHSNGMSVVLHNSNVDAQGVTFDEFTTELLKRQVKTM